MIEHILLSALAIFCVILVVCWVFIVIAFVLKLLSHNRNYKMIKSARLLPLNKDNSTVIEVVFTIDSQLPYYVHIVIPVVDTPDNSDRSIKKEKHSDMYQYDQREKRGTYELACEMVKAINRSNSK